MYSVEQKVWFNDAVAYNAICDGVMWGQLTPGRCQNTEKLGFVGCSTLMELVNANSEVSCVADSLGWPASHAHDVAFDGHNLSESGHRSVIDLQTEQDAPFCVVVPFPVGTWDGVSSFDVTRHWGIRDRVELEYRRACNVPVDCEDGGSAVGEGQTCGAREPLFPS